MAFRRRKFIRNGTYSQEPEIKLPGMEQLRHKIKLYIDKANFYGTDCQSVGFGKRQIPREEVLSGQPLQDFWKDHMGVGTGAGGDEEVMTRRQDEHRYKEETGMA